MVNPHNKNTLESDPYAKEALIWSGPYAKNQVFGPPVSACLIEVLLQGLQDLRFFFFFFLKKFGHNKC